MSHPLILKPLCLLSGRTLYLQSSWECYRIHTKSNVSLSTEECFVLELHVYSNSISIALWWLRNRNLKAEILF